MTRLIAGGWADFQHYKDRAPPWIKLHKKLLDNYDFHCLPDASRALAPMLWLLASEENDGSLDYDLDRLAFRLRQSPERIESAIKPLIDKGFFKLEQDASTTLAERKPDARLDRERGETETEGERRAPPVDNLPPEPAPKPSLAVQAAVAMRKRGLMDVTGSDPRLLRMLEQGVTVDALADLAGEAVKKGKSWAWAVAAFKGRQDEAGQIQAAPAAPWHESSAGIRAKGQELGLGDWDERAFSVGQGPAWPVYRAKVFKAAGHEPTRAAA